MYQLLQSQWAEAGIDMSIETLEQTVYITRVVVSDFQAAFSRNYGFSDPDTDYAFWSDTTANGVGSLSINFTQFTTPEMEQDLTTGRQSGYVDMRKQAYNDLVPRLNAGSPTSGSSAPPTPSSPTGRSRGWRRCRRSASPATSPRPGSPTSGAAPPEYLARSRRDLGAVTTPITHAGGARRIPLRTRRLRCGRATSAPGRGARFVPWRPRLDPARRR